MGRRVGTTLAGKYRLLRLLGAGGMGAVYEAEHARTGRRVAVKLMLAEHARDGELAARFLREARAAGRIEHPNVVQVLDADEASDGTLFIAQEYLTGHDLRRLLDERRALPPREALEILVPILSALVAAHRAGVLHRDRKPENIFLARATGGAVVPKLIDFGISKLTEADGAVASMTRTGAAMGTPYYFSPEQAQGERSLDAQADVWSMGVVLFEMLAGRTPFVGDSYNALLAQILTARVPRVDAVAPRVPRALADVVARALERDRARRFKSVANFLGALLDCQDVGDPAWRSSLRNTHRDAALATDDAMDEGPTVARAPRGGDDDVATAPIREISTTLGRSAREIPTPTHPRSRRARAAVGTGVFVLVATLGTLAWHPWSSHRVAPSRSAAIVPAPPTVLPAQASVAPSPASYVVSVVARPPSATIELDGAPTHASELARAFVRDGRPHRLVVSAVGYQSTTVEFVDAPPPSRVIELAPVRAVGSVRGPRVPRSTPAAATPSSATTAAPSAPTTPPANTAGVAPSNIPPAAPTGANGAPMPGL